MKIKVKASNNVIEFKESEKIDELQKEVNYLKELLNLKRNGKPDDVHRQLYILKKENTKLKKIAHDNNSPNRNLLGTPSYNSAASTARGAQRGLNLETFDPSRDSKIFPNIGTSVDIKPNDRYGEGSNDTTPLPVYSKGSSKYEQNSRPIKTMTTTLTSNAQERLTGEGRSSTDLQFAGAKILAGTYSRKPNLNNSGGGADGIPVRIRSHKKMDLQDGSKTRSLNQHMKINKNIKDKKGQTWKLDYLNDLEKRMKAGFKYNN
mmetsp:Transcript_32080/g.28445  ORF Transcript_32080/g.28445 Transcript_32080/m.28445 type:complete len:262 (+) Transcript_32080:119-904(+)